MGLLDRVKNAQQQAAGAMGGDMAAAKLANKLGAQGVEAPGVIRAIRATGGTDMGGGQKTEVDVTIAPDEGSPYDTTVTQSFQAAQLEGLAPGGAISVKYDPEDPSAALIYSW